MLLLFSVEHLKEGETEKTRGQSVRESGGREGDGDGKRLWRSSAGKSVWDVWACRKGRESATGRCIAQTEVEIERGEGKEGRHRRFTQASQIAEPNRKERENKRRRKESPKMRLTAQTIISKAPAFKKPLPLKGFALLL
jgi:hypothetical protein